MTREVLQAEADQGLALIEGFYDEVFAILHGWAPDVRADLEHHRADLPLSDAQLAALVEERSLDILRQEEAPIYGAGFCASEAIVSQGNPLAWWQGPALQPLASSMFGVGPGAVDLRRLEWYRRPELTGKSVIAGPFVDYLCSNEITLTASQPIYLDDTFAGVLCVDVLVSSFEEALLPRLESNNRVTVMNKSRRVLVSTDVALLTGDRVSVERAENPGSGLAESAKYPFFVLSEPVPSRAVSQV